VAFGSVEKSKKKEGITQEGPERGTQEIGKAKLFRAELWEGGGNTGLSSQTAFPLVGRKEFRLAGPGLPNWVPQGAGFITSDDRGEKNCFGTLNKKKGGGRN